MNEYGNHPEVVNMYEIQQFLLTAGLRLLTGIMWHIGSSVEKSVDAVATVAPHHREAVGLSVLLDDVT